MAGNPQVAQRMRAAAALMRKRGLRTSAMPGWETRGRSADFHPRAVIYHHTAAAVDVDRLLRDGRADLAGPLCNWALHRDGGWVAVAAGRANHAGEGILPSSESYGIEATGPNQPGASGPAAFDNYPQYVLGVACIFEVEGWDPSVGYGHKETARPLGRKIDPAFSIPDFEAAIRRAMLGGGIPTEEDPLAGEADAILQAIGKLGDRLVGERPFTLTAVGEKVERTFNQVNVKAGEVVAALVAVQAAVDDLVARLPAGAGLTPEQFEALKADLLAAMPSYTIAGLATPAAPPSPQEAPGV